MLAMEQISHSATAVRREWSSTIDAAVRVRPQFVQRTHDNVTMLNTETLSELLRGCKLHVTMYLEPDGSYTATVEELDLVENGKDKEACMHNLLAELRGYARDYYDEFNYWSAAPNRKAHLPYVMKILTTPESVLREDILCQDGKN